MHAYPQAGALPAAFAVALHSSCRPRGPIHPALQVRDPADLTLGGQVFAGFSWRLCTRRAASDHLTGTRIGSGLALWATQRNSVVPSEGGSGGNPSARRASGRGDSCTLGRSTRDGVKRRGGRGREDSGQGLRTDPPRFELGHSLALQSLGHASVSPICKGRVRMPPGWRGFWEDRVRVSGRTVSARRARAALFRRPGWSWRSLRAPRPAPTHLPVLGGNNRNEMMRLQIK